MYHLLMEFWDHQMLMEDVVVESIDEELDQNNIILA
jgi:hypothetical protein